MGEKNARVMKKSAVETWKTNVSFNIQETRVRNSTVFQGRKICNQFFARDSQIDIGLSVKALHFKLCIVIF